MELTNFAFFPPIDDIKNDIIKVRAGGGIVHDSDPESEYQESLNKAQSIFNAIEEMD